MNEILMLATLALVHCVALVSPGPDFALVVQNASRYGRQTGVFIALGLSLGILTHAILSVAGISLIIQQQPILYQLLQTLAGGYLLYLGVLSIKSTHRNWHKKQGVALSEQAIISQKRQAFSKGLMTNLLNPKALVFFISLMSSIIPANTSGLIKVSALLLIWGLSFAWFSTLAWLLTKKSSQTLLSNISRYIDLTCGVVFSTIGLGILWQGLFA